MLGQIILKMEVLITLLIFNMRSLNEKIFSKRPYDVICSVTYIGVFF